MKRLAILLGLILSACATTSGSKTGPALSEREEVQLALQQGNGKSALPRIEKLHAAQPKDLQLARMLAEAHVQAGSGAVLLERLTADDALTHYMKGLVRFARAAEANGAAIVEFQRAIELEPNEPEFQYRLGVALVESEQYEQALASLQRATSMAPEHAGWFLPLAKARSRTGDAKGAVAAIRTVVTGNASLADVKTAKALMAQLSDPFATLPQAARGRLEQALQWMEVADVPQQSIVQLEELLQEYPDQAGLHALLGLAYQRLDDAGRAVDELQRAIELAPEDGKNHLYLAQLYLSRQRTKSAEEHLHQAVERNPVLDDAWFKLGDLSLERQDYVSAREDFQVASRLDGDSVPAHGKLALVHQLEKNWPAADRELHLVLEKDPDNLEFMLRLGVLHTEHYASAKSSAEREAAAKEATVWLEKVLAAQPENALASRALERLKQK